MEIVNFTPLTALLGGIFMGLSAAILMLFNGKIAGISGISKGIISKNSTSLEDRRWRIFFVGGLLIGGALMVLIIPETTAKVRTFNLFQVMIAGLLVGIGTALGNGCTSGHGICGLGRKSLRSLIAVITFMGAGFLTVYILFHVINAGV
jgi:uncharacterized membrane protein YedE/YeeE